MIAAASIRKPALEKQMDKLTFKKITSELKCGREIEFSYLGKQYSITNSNSYWNFCCDTDGTLLEQLCAFDDKEKLINCLSNICIENILLPNIFDEEKYDSGSVCVL